jgi:uncharacterized protein
LPNTDLPAEYRKILEKAKSQRKEIVKKLSGLSGKKLSGLDVFVHDCHDEVFSRIDCTACANCCKTLGPLFTQSDVARLSSFHGMKPGDFTQKFLRVDEDGDTVFKTVPCFFLGENLCTCYEERPRACREYPHTDEKNMASKMKRLSQNTLYCPGAYEIAVKIIEQYCKS